MKLSSRRTFLILLLCIVATSVSAQVFRIGSAAPENSPWGRSLNRIAAEWRRISNGRVRVQVFHNGIAGDEDDMVRKMRIGQLQAVVMTNTGISNFSDQLLTLSMPLLIRDQDEFDYVFERVQESLEEDIKDDGFRVLTWSTAGWLYFFSKSRLTTPNELKNLKMAASQGEMELIRAYQLMGYQAIAVPYTERLAALASGMVEAYLSVPILAAGFQWFATTPFMVDLQIGPAPGGILMSERAYRMLPQETRDEMIAFAREVGAELNADILDLEEEAIATMSEFGLNIVSLSEAEHETWIDELEDSYDVMLGSVFEEDFYLRIRELLSEYRESR